jgi:heme o synthase
MKVCVSTLPTPPATDKVERGWAGLLMDLTKARLTTMVLVTTAVGFYVGFQGALNWALMLHTIFGTGLLAAGAAALNQLLERDHDALMQRTAGRPLPAGLLQPDSVLIIGGVCAAGGLVWLALAVNLLTATLGVLTLVSYLFVYTPLKRITPLNTVIGAIPGALPPLLGWTAARGEISIGGWSLFAILFFWQLPHFFAIAWIYREQYAKAGYVMLPSVDPTGERTSRQAVSHTLGLLPISLTPFIFRLAGPVYLFGALILGLVFLLFAIQFSRRLTEQHARYLFYASIIYLPLLLGLMVADRIP